jgi:hypothetical protein
MQKEISNNGTIVCQIFLPHDFEEDVGKGNTVYQYLGNNQTSSVY